MTTCILRTGSLLDAANSLLQTTRDDLVAADDHIDNIRPVAQSGNAIARTVDLHDQSVFCDGIGGAEIDLGFHCFVKKCGTIGRRSFPVPKHSVPLLAQLRVQIHLLDGHAAADGDGFACRHIAEDKTGGVFCASEYSGFKAAFAKALCDGVELFKHGEHYLSYMNICFYYISFRSKWKEEKGA